MFRPAASPGSPQLVWTFSAIPNGTAGAPPRVQLRSTWEMPVLQRRILVCDDNEDNRIVFRTILEHAGYAVVAVEDGAEALEQIRTFTPSLILLDLMMPGLDGWGTIAALKDHPVTKTIPVIAVTADMNVSKSVLKAAGFCALVRKPAFPRQVLKAVGECLQRTAQFPGEWVELASGSESWV